MSLSGTRFEQGGHTWEVTSSRREGPEWRINLRSVSEPRCRMTGYLETARPPHTSDVVRGLKEPRYRWFVDNEDRVWRAEVSPRYDFGRVVGAWVVFAADDGPDREKYSLDAAPELGMLQDIQLLELLLRARKGL